jgi:hypothetical protein
MTYPEGMISSFQLNWTCPNHALCRAVGLWAKAPKFGRRQTHPLPKGAELRAQIHRATHCRAGSCPAGSSHESGPPKRLCPAPALRRPAAGDDRECCLRPVMSTSRTPRTQASEAGSRARSRAWRQDLIRPSAPAVGLLLLAAHEALAHMTSNKSVPCPGGVARFGRRRKMGEKLHRQRTRLHPCCEACKHWEPIPTTSPIG